MTTGIPDDRDVDQLLDELAFEDRELLLDAVERGLAVRNDAHAGLAVAVARRRARHALRRDLPVYGASAVLAGVMGYFVTRNSAGFAFALVLGGAGFVGWLWWAETWRPRRRAACVNQALLEGGAPPDRPQPDRSTAAEWLLVVPLAWAATLFVGLLVRLVGAPTWIGAPLFVVALVLSRRLVGRTVESIDEWGHRGGSR